MALVPVALQQVATLNNKVVQGAQPLVPANWVPVHVRGSDACCGVWAGVLQPYQQCGPGSVVIPPYCPPVVPPSTSAAQQAQAQQIAIIQAGVGQALSQAPPQTTISSPYEHPGYRGRRVWLTWQIVMTGGNNPSGGDFLYGAIENPNFTSFQPPAFSGTYFEPAYSTDQILYITLANNATPAPVINFTIPSGKRAWIDVMKFSSSAATASKLVKWFVYRSGDLVIPEFKFVNENKVELQFPANGDDVVQISAINPDNNAAWLFGITVGLWLLPAVTQTDSVYSTVLRNDPSNPPSPAQCGGTN